MKLLARSVASFSLSHAIFPSSASLKYFFKQNQNALLILQSMPLIKRLNFIMNFNFPATLFLAVTLLLTCSEALKLGQSCVANGNCDSGLHCETCLANGNVRPRCTRLQPVNPLSKVKGLPFNRYCWLTTHNSFAKLKTKSGT